MSNASLKVFFLGSLSVWPITVTGNTGPRHTDRGYHWSGEGTTPGDYYVASSGTCPNHIYDLFDAFPEASYGSNKRRNQTSYYPSSSTTSTTTTTTTISTTTATATTTTTTSISTSTNTTLSALKTLVNSKTRNPQDHMVQSPSLSEPLSTETQSIQPPPNTTITSMTPLNSLDLPPIVKSVKNEPMDGLKYHPNGHSLYVHLCEGTSRKWWKDKDDKDLSSSAYYHLFILNLTANYDECRNSIPPFLLSKLPDIPLHVHCGGLVYLEWLVDALGLNFSNLPIAVYGRMNVIREAEECRITEIMVVRKTRQRTINMLTSLQDIEIITHESMWNMVYRSIAMIRLQEFKSQLDFLGASDSPVCYYVRRDDTLASSSIEGELSIDVDDDSLVRVISEKFVVDIVKMQYSNAPNSDNICTYRVFSANIGTDFRRRLIVAEEDFSNKNATFLYQTHLKLGYQPYFHITVAQLNADIIEFLTSCYEVFKTAGIQTVIHEGKAPFDTDGVESIGETAILITFVSKYDVNMLNNSNQEFKYLNPTSEESIMELQDFVTSVQRGSFGGVPHNRVSGHIGMYRSVVTLSDWSFQCLVYGKGGYIVSSDGLNRFSCDVDKGRDVLVGFLNSDELFSYQFQETLTEVGYRLQGYNSLMVAMIDTKNNHLPPTRMVGIPLKIPSLHYFFSTSKCIDDQIKCKPQVMSLEFDGDMRSVDGVLEWVYLVSRVDIVRLSI